MTTALRLTALIVITIVEAWENWWERNSDKIDEWLIYENYDGSTNDSDALNNIMIALLVSIGVSALAISIKIAFFAGF